MLNRQQELNTQFHQLIDAFVLAFSLFAAQRCGSTARAGSICPTQSILSRITSGC